MALLSNEKFEEVRKGKTVLLSGCSYNNSRNETINTSAECCHRVKGSHVSSEHQQERSKGLRLGVKMCVASFYILIHVLLQMIYISII